MKLRSPLEGDWPISQRFGERPAYYAQWDWAGHPGIDYACPIGTPVLACIDGWCEPRYDAGGWGDYVRVHTSDGEWMTLQAHLSRATVVFGQRVKAGDVIALSGNSGNSDGPHLHGGVQWKKLPNPRFKGWINPESWFKEETMTKTSLHIQRIEPWMQQAIRDLGADWVKLVNPPAGPDPMPRIPNKLVRLWTDDIDENYIARGREGGRDFVASMVQPWLDRPWATCYSLANEPECNSNEGLANLCTYSIGAMEEASVLGITLVILECSEASPHNNDLPGDEHIRWKMQQLAPAVETAIALGHYVGRHAYWRPEVEGPLGEHHALGRIIRDVEYWADAGVPIDGLRLLLTEWGVDGGIAGHTSQQGWRDLYPFSSDYYIEVLNGERAARDLPWLQTMFLFTAGFEPPWKGYNHDSNDISCIATMVPEPAMPPVEEPSIPDGKLTDAEMQTARDWFGIDVAASFKWFVRHRMHPWGEPIVVTGKHVIAVAFDPAYNKDVAVKFAWGTWEPMDQKPL